MSANPHSAGPPRNSLTPLLLALLSMVVGSLICAVITTPSDSSAQSQLPTVPVSVEVEETLTGDWPQWGGDSSRNNAPVGRGIPTDWEVGDFDSQTNDWVPGSSDKVKWVSRVGSQTYGNPVIAGGRVYVGTNNGRGYLQRYPADVDLGCLLAFDATDGKFLWQHSNEKLPAEREQIYDWPQQGICCAPLVEGNRVWYVTSRGTVACLDAEGYYDDEDDGPQQAAPAILFKEDPDIAAGLDDGSLSAGLRALLAAQDVAVDGRLRINGSAAEGWSLRVTTKKAKRYFRLRQEGQELAIAELAAEDDTSAGEPLVSTVVDMTAGLKNGKLGTALAGLLAARGCPINSAVVSQDGKGWIVAGNLNGEPRQVKISMRGPSLTASLMTTTADKHEADEVWTFDMMAELKVSQHNMCSCSVTSWGDILFVSTSNGVDESHEHIPSVDAPSFIALDKNTGELLWSDASPGANILHGQWSSPSVGEVNGVAQAVFAGGDGWVYSFKADRGENGRPELIWKFDANPKETEWIDGGRGTRNSIIGTPVWWHGKVYVAVGQDPEHGEGVGHLWCLDPSKRGDISAELAVHQDDRATPLPPRRLQAFDADAGEIAIENPNSGVIWHYSTFDQNDDGEIDFEETMHRSLGTVAIKDGLLFIADLSGLFHCLDADTGKVHWTYDLLSAAWGSPLVVENHVYIGDEDGELAIFELTAEPHEPIAEIDIRNAMYGAPVVSHNTLYISNKTHLFAINADEAAQ